MAEVAASVAVCLSASESTGASGFSATRVPMAVWRSVNAAYPAGGFAWPIVVSTGSTCPWNELIVARIRCSRSSCALALRSATNPATSPTITTTPRMLRITSQNSRLATRRFLTG